MSATAETKVDALDLGPGGGTREQNDLDSRNPLNDTLPLFKNLPLVRLGSEPHVGPQQYNRSWKLAWPKTLDYKRDSPTILFWCTKSYRTKSFEENWQLKSIKGVEPWIDLEEIRNQVGLYRMYPR